MEAIEAMVRTERRTKGRESVKTEDGVTNGAIMEMGNDGQRSRGQSDDTVEGGSAHGVRSGGRSLPGNEDACSRNTRKKSKRNLDDEGYSVLW